MSDNLHSSLPVEYQLQYGTACGNLDISQFVNKAAINGIPGAHGDLSQEEVFRVIRVDACPIVVDGFDALLIGANRR